MSNSQLSVYTSSDTTGPGMMTGEVGKALTILDACLVDGYSGHTAAGWSKPIANSGSLGCYKQGAGSQCTLLVNDNGPNGTSTYKEAWTTGWETLVSIAAPVGTGFGQFPLPAQLLTTGHSVLRKSASLDAVGRPWVVFADSRTFYLFVQAGDTASAYTTLVFGDLFSFKSTPDLYSCQIISRTAENSAADNVDGFGACAGNIGMPTTIAGGFIARTFSGTGFSITRGQNGDPGKASTAAMLSGSLPTPNGPDNSIYLSPVFVTEPSSSTMRGRLRGVFQVLHPATSFSDGQIIQGVGDYSGKTFRIVKPILNLGAGTSATCFAAIEISNTVETN